MISQELTKHFDAVRVSNNDSPREGGWSSVPEIEQHKEYVGLKSVNVSTLNQLVKMKHVEKKLNLYRVTSGGILFFDSQAGASGRETGGGSPGGDYTPPGQDGGQDPRYPPKDYPQDYPQDDPRNPNYKTTEGGGAGTTGVGVPAPMPVSGMTESVIKNLM